MMSPGMIDMLGKIGPVIRELRGNRTQKEVALLAGIQHTYWSDIETIKKLPPLDTFLAIANALGADPIAMLLKAQLDAVLSPTVMPFADIETMLEVVKGSLPIDKKSLIQDALREQLAKK